MALSNADCYFILSHGMYGGAIEEDTTTAEERYTRILSQGLLDLFPEPMTILGSVFYKLRKGGARLWAGASKIFKNRGMR